MCLACLTCLRWERRHLAGVWVTDLPPTWFYESPAGMPALPGLPSNGRDAIYAKHVHGAMGSVCRSGREFSLLVWRTVIIISFTLSAALNILLAEDREDDVVLMQQAFNKAGVTSRLHVVRDGAEALAYLKGEGKYADRSAFPAPDVLLLDVNMPQLNGFEVLAWVREEPSYSRLMVHMLSGSSLEADVQRSYDLRANSYVVKPNRVDDLIAFVSAFHVLHRFVRLPQKLVYWDGHLTEREVS